MNHTWTNIRTNVEIIFNAFTTMKEIAFVLSKIEPINYCPLGLKEEEKWRVYSP